MKIKSLFSFLVFAIIFESGLQLGEVNFDIIDQYIEELMTQSTPEIPVWNIEKAKAGKKSGWDYIDGCMIMALLEIYATTKEEKYLNFADYYEDFRISDDGTIDGYNKEEWNLDNINGAKNLITLYELTKKKKYRKAAAKIFQQIEEQPRTSEGNFWHKKIYPNQVWLDGLYMALPYYMEYEVLYDNSENINDIYRQFFNVYDKMRDKNTGLYYHGYDSTKSIFWANKETGLSQNFWLRSLGWYSMALLDTLNKADDKGSQNWNKLKEIFVQLCDSMLAFQDETGMWWQVPNYPNKGANYLETSGSAIYAYSLLKGARTGILEDEKYRKAGKKAFEGICNKYLKTKDGKLSLGGICLVAGLGPENKPNRDGSFEYYMSESIVEDDAKGVGPFILAYNEYRLLE
jgi:unsaturated rhamnogalacturonyl hydrolase